MIDAARKAGACDNAKGIRRDVLEGFVLETLKDHLMHPDLVKEFITAFHAELNTESHSRAQLEQQTQKNWPMSIVASTTSSQRSRKASAQLIYRTSLMACQLRNASLKESSRRQNPVFPFSTRTWQCCIAARSQS